MSKGAAYYDAIYKQMANQSSDIDEWLADRFVKVAPHVRGSVLDLGCGTGEMSNYVAGVYLGVDFSDFAIATAIRRTNNKQARFIKSSFTDLSGVGKYDTVLMLEVLEHLTDYMPVVRFALAHARDRVVVTVPRDMPGRAHVHPQWNEKKLAEVLGPLTTCHLFGGETNDRWWLAVKEIKC